ncbi:hypothetical protein VIGAN_11187300, partial [Vigna angularis var. angularis]
DVDQCSWNGNSSLQTLFPCVLMPMKKILLLHLSLSYCGSHMVLLDSLCCNQKGHCLSHCKKSPLIILTLSICARHPFLSSSLIS